MAQMRAERLHRYADTSMAHDVQSLIAAHI